MTQDLSSQMILNSDQLRRHGNDRKCLESYIGKKAVGLTLLPENWSPPFFAVSISAHRLLAAPGDEKASEVMRSPSAILSKALGSDLKTELESLHADRVIVRSSSPTESLGDRGLYQSRICDAIEDDVVDQAVTILTHAETAKKTSPSTESGSLMAFIVQKLVKANAVGHLSNERRVSRRTTDWLCEWTSPSGDFRRLKRFSVREMATPNASALLACRNQQEWLFALQNVAGLLTPLPQRFHLEWIWDGKRVWIVQRDVEENVIADAPNCGWFGRPTKLCSSELSTLRTLETVRGDWRKLQCLKTFAACNLPCPSVYVLEEHDFQSSAATFEGLRSDLERLLTLPIVIRTDVVEQVHESGFLLPRTETIKSIEEAIAFINKTTVHFLGKGILANQFCFIMHQFITANAGAWTLAKPDVRRIRIDSIWGLPDGLLFYPHDSSEVDLTAAPTVKVRTRCKSRYLGVDQRGDWSERPCGPPWDWEPSLKKSQHVEMARASHRVAEYIRRPVQIMFFVGVDSADGNMICLPWFYSTDEHPEFAVSGTDTSFYRPLIGISSKADIVRVEDFAKLSMIPKGTVLRLRPGVEVLRSEDFIKEVGKLAVTNKLVVELEGSLLAHAYYTLARTGANVKCTEIFSPRGSLRRFGKLVRDKIPVRIISQGEDARVHHVERDNLIPFLKAKALEEAFELFWEQDSERVLEELADVLEVIRAFCNVRGMDFEKIIAMADKKRLERGGFDKGVILIETRERPLTSQYEQQMPLFADQIRRESAQQIPASVQTLNDVLANVQKPRIHANELVIPLVPPQTNRFKPNDFEGLVYEGYELIIQYEEAHVRVAFRPSIRLRDSEQGMLF